MARPEDLAHFNHWPEPQMLNGWWLATFDGLIRGMEWPKKELGKKRQRANLNCQMPK
jgi:hypothetical protein